MYRQRSASSSSGGKRTTTSGNPHHQNRPCAVNPANRYACRGRCCIVGRIDRHIVGAGGKQVKALRHAAQPRGPGLRRLVRRHCGHGGGEGGVSGHQ